MCMVADEDFWSLYQERHRTARKPHPCGECGRTVDPGERYFVADGVSDGAWVTYKMCAHCYEVCQWLAVACGGWVYMAIEEDLEEHVIGDEAYLRSASLIRLLRWMRGGWVDRTGTLRPVDSVHAVQERAVDAYRARLARTVAA